MNIEPDYSVADQDLELSYDMMTRAIDREGNMTEGVEDVLDGMYDTVQEEISGYKQNISEAVEAMETGEDADLLESMTEAGQHLANAYHEATVLYNKGESALHNGEEGLESNVTSFSIGESSENVGLLNQAVGLKEDAFGGYEQTLQDVAREVVDYNMDEGVITHLDIGIEQQTPDL